MSYQNDRSYTDFRGVNLREGNGAIRFTTPDVTPTTTSGERILYVNSSNELIYDDGSSTTTIGAAGGGGATPTWETIYSRDATFGLSGAWTLAGASAGAADVLVVTNTGAGSGDCIQITNSGTGSDIKGTSDNWSVSKAGAAVFVGVTPGGDITSTGTAIDWDLADNNASALSFDASGAAGILAIVTTNGSEAVTMANALTVSGQTTCSVGSNTVSSLVVTDNTASTFGADADSSGVAVIRSTSLTTGSLLQLQLTEGTLNGGFYLTGRDVTGSANVYTVGEDGATVIAGAGGSNMLTVTAGDAVISDGSLSVTDADNAATVTVINNTVTTANATVDVSSTSITTGALMRLNANTTAHDGEVLEIINAGDTTSTGTGISVTMPDITTGAATGIDVVMAGLTTTGFGIKVTMDAITTGDMLYLDNGGGTLTGAGRFINCNDDDASLFSVAGDGATVIAGTATGTDALTLTAGDLTLTSGDATLTAGDLVLTDSDASTITSVNGTGSTLTVTNNGDAGADKAAVEILSDGTGNADSAVLRVTQDSLTGASFCINVKQDDLDVGFINFEGTATADANSPISTHGTAGATTDFVRVAINGTKAWIAVSTSDPSA
jgi:hypothetical protein